MKKPYNSFSMALIVLILLYPAKGMSQDIPSSQPKVKTVKIIRDRDRTLEWSRAKNLVAFSMLGDDGYYDIGVMNTDGSGVKCLTCAQNALPDKHISNPTWHPSGEYIVMQVEKEEHFGTSVFSTPGIGFNCDLYAMTSDGRQYYRLTNLPTKRNIRDWHSVTGVLHPHFSHDGKRLFWGQLVKYTDSEVEKSKGDMGIWEMKIADFVVDEKGAHLENIKTFTPGKQKKWYESHGFSSDDKKIIFSGSLETGQGDTGMDIYTLNLQTQELKRLTHTLVQWDEHAHYSPDGKKIVWISSVNDFDPGSWRKTMKTEYFIMNADGSDKAQLTFFNTPGHEHYKIFNGRRVICADSSWNADGTQIMASIAVEGQPYIIAILF